jgi:hypothetical protein
MKEKESRERPKCRFGPAIVADAVDWSFFRIDVEQSNIKALFKQFSPEGTACIPVLKAIIA